MINSYYYKIFFISCIDSALPAFKGNLNSKLFKLRPSIEASVASIFPSLLKSIEFNKSNKNFSFLE